MAPGNSDQALAIVHVANIDFEQGSRFGHLTRLQGMEQNTPLELAHVILPLGEIATIIAYARASDGALLRIGFLNTTHDVAWHHAKTEHLVWHNCQQGVRLVVADEPFTEFAEQLAAYADGTLREFSVPHILLGPAQISRYQRTLGTIPYGETRTYTQLGGGRAYAQAAGQACARNPLPILLPCHRVVQRTGGLGAGYVGGLAVKRALLAREGIAFS